MGIRKYKMTPYQKIARLKQINQYYIDNPECTIKDVVIFNPAVSSSLVQQYSKLYTETVRDGTQDEIIHQDRVNYVYGV